jgi:hypothetical protein
MTVVEPEVRLIRDANRLTGPVLALIAVILNFLTVPMAISLWGIVVTERQVEAAFGFVFPLISFLLLIWAVRKNLQLIVHGVASFEIEGGKGRVGADLHGWVRNRRTTKFSNAVTAKLQCIRSVTRGSGDSASSRRGAVWTGERSFRPERVDLREGLELSLPIPGALPPSGKVSSDSSVTWELHVTAPSAPVNFHARFIIPVFKGAMS